MKEITEQSVDYGLDKFLTWVKFQRERNGSRERFDGLVRFAEAVGFSDESRRHLDSRLKNASSKYSHWIMLGVLIGSFISEHHYEQYTKELEHDVEMLRSLMDPT